LRNIDETYLGFFYENALYKLTVFTYFQVMSLPDHLVDSNPTDSHRKLADV